MVSESRLLGPVAVLGDFNAHLGLLEGESRNLQQVHCRSCWKDVRSLLYLWDPWRLVLSTTIAVVMCKPQWITF